MDNAIVVAGTGASSRANIEALIEDYLYSHGQEIGFVLVYDKKPSQGQVFAAQFARDKGKEIVVICNEDASYDGIPGASVVFSENHKKTLKQMYDANFVAFVLIDDEDTEQWQLLESFHKLGILMFDLTEGLVPIKYDDKFKKPTEPVIPEAEKVEEENPSEETAEEDLEPEVEEEEEENPDEEEDQTLDELEDEAYFGMMAFAKMIAKLVVKEINKSSEEGEK